MAYLLLLERGVDGLSSKNGTGAASRLALTSLVLVAAVKIAADSSDSAALLREQIIAGAAGFFLYKAAVLIEGARGGEGS